MSQLGVVPEHVIDRTVQRIGDELEVAGRQVTATHDQRNMPQTLPQRCAGCEVSFVGDGKESESTSLPSRRPKNRAEPR